MPASPRRLFCIRHQHLRDVDPGLVVRPMFSFLMRPPIYPSFRWRDGLLAFAYPLHAVLAAMLLVSIVVAKRANGIGATMRVSAPGFSSVGSAYY